LRATRIYDQRRRELTPAHDLTLLIIRTAQLTGDARGRLVRDSGTDLAVLRPLVAGALVAPGQLHEHSVKPRPVVS
jgi:hypothetical protein